MKGVIDEGSGQDFLFKVSRKSLKVIFPIFSHFATPGRMTLPCQLSAWRAARSCTLTDSPIIRISIDLWHLVVAKYANTLSATTGYGVGSGHLLSSRTLLV